MRHARKRFERIKLLLRRMGDEEGLIRRVQAD
jgi:hypothetical protein